MVKLRGGDRALMSSSSYTESGSGYVQDEKSMPDNRPVAVVTGASRGAGPGIAQLSAAMAAPSTSPGAPDGR